MTHTFTQPEGAKILVLRKGLELEIKGLHKRGPSCHSMLKEIFGLKGNKQEVLKWVNLYIDTHILPKVTP